MSRKTQAKNITIKDDDGGSHEYLIIPYGGEMACDMHIEILELIGSAIDQTSGLSSGIRGISELIARKGGSKFVRSMLTGVTRDGVAIGGEGDAALAAFSQTYQANMGELYAALAATLEVNYGAFFKRRVRTWLEGHLPTLITQFSDFIETLPIDTGLTGVSGPSGAPDAPAS